MHKDWQNRSYTHTCTWGEGVLKQCTCQYQVGKKLISVGGGMWTVVLHSMQMKMGENEYSTRNK